MSRCASTWSGWSPRLGAEEVARHICSLARHRTLMLPEDATAAAAMRPAGPPRPAPARGGRRGARPGRLRPHRRSGVMARTKPSADVAYLCRALKAPSLAAAVERMHRRRRRKADGPRHRAACSASSEPQSSRPWPSAQSAWRSWSRTSSPWGPSPCSPRRSSSRCAASRSRTSTTRRGSAGSSRASAGGRAGVSADHDTARCARPPPGRLAVALVLVPVPVFFFVEVVARAWRRPPSAATGNVRLVVGQESRRRSRTS